MKIRCDFCNREYNIKPFNFKRSKNHYCSVKCHNKASMKKEHDILTKDVLYEEYIIKGKSTVKISKKYSTSPSVISKWLKTYKIPVRSLTESAHTDRGKFIERDFLIKQYIENKKSMEVIAKEIGVHNSTVRKYLLVHDIKPRTLSESRTGELSPKYIGEKPSCGECGKKLNNHKGKWCWDCFHNIVHKRDYTNWWKGGVSDLNNLIRGSIIYKKWRTDVFERDNYKCTKCGNAGKINAHHLKSFSNKMSEFLNFYNKYNPKKDKYILSELAYTWKPLWTIDDAITLCVSCHRKIHKKEVDNAIR